MRSPARQPRGSRAEREAGARRTRARAHLQRMRGRPARIRAPWRSLALAVFAASALLGLLVGSPLFPGARHWLPDAGPALGAIHVRGAAQLSPAEIATATGVAPGSARSAVDAGTVARDLAAHPWIARARALRLPSGNLVVDVVEREPLAVVATPEGDFFVDAGGAPFAPVQGNALPLPRLVPAAPPVASQADPELARALALALRLPGLGLPLPARVEIAQADDPKGFVLQFAEPPLRVTLGRDDPDAALPRLAELLAAHLPALSEGGSVDLRFADQAVLRETPAPEGAEQAAAGRGGASPSRARPTG